MLAAVAIQSWATSGLETVALNTVNSIHRTLNSLQRGQKNTFYIRYTMNILQIGVC